jgi:hypothetical protein
MLKLFSRNRIAFLKISASEGQQRIPLNAGLRGSLMKLLQQVKEEKQTDVCAFIFSFTN